METNQKSKDSIEHPSRRLYTGWRFSITIRIKQTAQEMIPRYPIIRDAVIFLRVLGYVWSTEIAILDKVLEIGLGIGTKVGLYPPPRVFVG